jgi:hypothetical protein
VAENFFNVFREVCVEDRGLAGFFFVRFCQRNALRDAAAHRLGGVKDSYSPLATFDDDLLPRSHACHQRSKVARRFRLRDVDHILIHETIIHRSSTLGFWQDLRLQKLNSYLRG